MCQIFGKFGVFRFFFFDYFQLRFFEEIRVVEFSQAEVEIFLEFRDLLFKTLNFVGEIDESCKRDIERSAFYEGTCGLFVRCESVNKFDIFYSCELDYVFKFLVYRVKIIDFFIIRKLHEAESHRVVDFVDGLAYHPSSEQLFVL